MKESWNRFWVWFRSTLDMLCDRPDHLQRLSVIGAGASLYPVMIAVLVLLWWFGKSSPALASIALPLIFQFGVGIMILFGLVIVVLIGLVKGLTSFKANLPGGSVEIETTAKTTVSSGDPE